MGPATEIKQTHFTLTSPKTDSTSEASERLISNCTFCPEGVALLASVYT